ncbi:uncharacterized protein BDR25DRAFT_228481, partial [Lindgomyces ingoldianus]
GRSELVIIKRDPKAKCRGYSADLYIKTLCQGLLPYYRPRQIFMQDNALIYNA